VDGTISNGRDPLTRARIAEAALAFVDEHGLGSLSMRKLAGALGFEAMSLYNHVANKDDLLDALAELLYEEILTVYAARPAEGRWDADALAVARAFRRVALAHPEALTLVTHRPIRGAAGMGFLAEIQAIFSLLGLSDREAAQAFTAASAYVVGSLTLELGLVRAVRRSADGNVLPDHLRHLHAAELADDTSAEARFEWGLRAVLDGILVQVGHPIREA
jgi:TetR/AcrR family transcriptional regulator, tetracycline repressor protein